MAKLELAAVLQDKEGLIALLNTIIENAVAADMEKTCIAVNVFNVAFDRVKTDWIIGRIVDVITPSMSCLSYGHRSGFELNELADLLWVVGFKLARVPEDFNTENNKSKYLDIVIPMLSDLNAAGKP